MASVKRQFVQVVQKRKEASSSPDASCTFLISQVLRQIYCRTGQAPPVQPAVIGVLPAAPTFIWSTPSSFEQKFRTPVTLNDAGELPTTYCTLIPALAV